jgi:predicted molibdopterin-dependent oxidoreductase YjgC
LADKLSVTDGEVVRVSSRRGTVNVKAKVTDRVEDDVVFMPFHFAEGAANMLTNPVYDSIAKIPELKVCAVRVDKVS